MSSMAKRKTADGGGEKKRYPSRENTRYVAIPKALYEALEQYAKARSDEDERKSVSWAARVLIRRGLTDEKMWPPPEGK